MRALRRCSGKILFFAGAILLLSQLAWARPLHVGSVGLEVEEEIQKYMPLATYLARALQAEGVDQGKVVVAKGIPEMAQLLKHGKIDLYIDSPYPALAVSRLSGSKLFLRRWKKGISEYRSVIFAKAASGIARLEDLKGKIIAFEEEFSTSGYFVPKLVMMQQGLKLVPKKNPADPVAPHEVGYVFSLDDENAMAWVLRGRVSASVMDNQTYVKQAMAHLSNLKVVYQSFSFPRQVVSHRGDLPSDLAAKIKQTLIQMEQSEEGKKVLQSFERTTRFDEIPDQAMVPLLKAGKWIDAELGIR